MKEPEVTDAEFELVAAPFRIPWVTIFWFCIYAGSAAAACYQEADPVARAAITFAAAALWPLGRLALSVTQKVSEQEAQLARQHLLGRGSRRASRAVARRG